MTDLPHTPFTFKTHCSKCPATCCNGKVIVATSVEYQAIMAQGVPDHFAKVSFQGLDYVVLDNEHGLCGYNKNGRCTIEGTKPMTCRSFPALLQFDENGTFTGVGFAGDECPAVAFMSAGRKLELRQLALQNMAMLPHDAHETVLDIYDRRHDESLMREIGAQVILPAPGL